MDVPERFGIVGKLLFSEQDTAVRLAVGKEPEGSGPVTLNSAELRCLGRQAYVLARRLDGRTAK